MMTKLSTELSGRNGCIVEKGAHNLPTLSNNEGYSGQYGGYQIDESENEVKSA